MDTKRSNLDQPEGTQLLVVRNLIISRFPMFENHILEAFHQSSLFRELCEDYVRVFVCLSEMSLQGDGANANDEEHLKRLKCELEQELFRYFKNHKSEPMNDEMLKGKCHSAMSVVSETLTTTQAAQTNPLEITKIRKRSNFQKEK